jgi:hypothetical protein
MQAFQTICSKGLSFPMHNSPDQVYGLILRLGQDLLYDLLMNIMSILVIFPSDTDPSSQYPFNPSMVLNPSRIVDVHGGKICC